MMKTTIITHINRVFTECQVIYNGFLCIFFFIIIITPIFPIQKLKPKEIKQLSQVDKETTQGIKPRSVLN